MLCFMIRNIAYHPRKLRTIISPVWDAIRHKGNFAACASHFLLSMCPDLCITPPHIYTLCSLHTFLPPADTKNLPHIKNVREAFSVICYIALILAFRRLAFGVFSLIEKLAFGNVCGLISKPVQIEIVNVCLLAYCVLTHAVFIVRGE